jgi:prolyl-tRNA synthetase
MKDSYSLDADWEGLDAQYRAHYQAYFNIFHRCHLPVIAVQSDVGMMGGQLAHEYMYLTSIGEDTLVLCDACGYAANRQVAQVHKPAPAPETPLPLERARRRHRDDDDPAGILGPTSRTAKAVFYMATKLIPADAICDAATVYFCGGPGDTDLNETKLTNAIAARELRLAHEDEIRAVEPSQAMPPP